MIVFGLCALLNWYMTITRPIGRDTLFAAVIMSFGTIVAWFKWRREIRDQQD